MSGVPCTLACIGFNMNTGTVQRLEYKYIRWGSKGGSRSGVVNLQVFLGGGGGCKLTGVLGCSIPPWLLRLQ